MQSERGLDMTVVNLIVLIFGGVLGGNFAGGVLKKYGLGVIGNTIAGGVGGVFVGQVLARFLGMSDVSVMVDVIANIAGSVVGGGILVLMLGDCFRRIRKLTDRSK